MKRLKEAAREPVLVLTPELRARAEAAIAARMTGVIPKEEFPHHRAFAAFLAVEALIEAGLFEGRSLTAGVRKDLARLAGGSGRSYADSC